MRTQDKTISELAFALWQARGCPIGSSEIDWLAAERQVMGNFKGTLNGNPVELDLWGWQRKPRD